MRPLHDTDDRDPYYDDTARPCLIIDLPRDISDEAVVHFSELLQEFVMRFEAHYLEQLRRAHRAAQLEYEEFHRIQTFIDPQLPLPFDDSIDGEPF